MATSVLQTIANRLNALRSTGPRSPEGKARSSRNALKHGLSSLGTRPPAEMAEAIAERVEQWRDDYRPEGSAQRWTFERLVAESVRLDCCEARILAARAEHAERASESWDDDRAAEVAALASRLARAPEHIQPLLLQSKHGVLWLLDRWAEVADLVRRADGWTQPTWHQALDLLGLSHTAREGTGPLDLDPEDCSAAPGLALIAEATEGLRSRLDAYLDARDERAQADAALGLDGDDSRSIRLLERYASDARRQCSRHLNELRRLQSLAPRPLSSSESRPGPSGPRPDRTRPRPEPAAAPPSNPIGNPAPASHPTDPIPPARNEPRGNPSLRPTSLLPGLPGASAPLNRRARRAQAAAARRS